MRNHLKKLLTFILAFALLSGHSFVAADSSWYLNTKNKIDQIVEAKIGKSKASLYLKKLEKIDISRYSENKKWIFNYLIRKLKSYAKDSSNSTTISTGNNTHLDSKDTLKNLPELINKLIPSVYKIVDLDSDGNFYEN